MEAKNNLITEEYTVKEFEKHFVRNVRWIMDDLGAWRAKDKHHQWSDRLWQRNKHLWIVSDHKHGNKQNRVTFKDKHYSKDSKIDLWGSRDDLGRQN